MRAYDFSPLYRSFVGLDRMAGLIDAAAASANAASNYPPFNVVRLSDNAYRIELAVSGFTQDQIDIQTHENVLTITGITAQIADNDASPDEAEYLHRGIAQRGFEKRFQLADHVEVSEAQLDNGLLTISLTRELPEALKPRKIAINSENGQKLITPSPRKRAKVA